MFKNKKQLLVYPPMMALALYTTLLGYMVPQLKEVFSLNYAQVGLFATLQAVGMAVSLVLCFCIFSAFNAIKISGISMIAFALLMVLFGINSYIIIAYVLFFVIGLVQNTIDALSNTVISETAKHSVSFYLGLMHGLWAFAGVLGPFLAIALGGSYRVTFIWLGVFMAVTAVLFIAGLWQHMKMPMIQNKQNVGGLGKIFRLLKIKGMPALVLINLFSCFVQNTYIIFIVSYINKAFSFALGGAVVLACLFLGLLIGRTLFSLFATKIPVLKTMAISNAVAILAFAGMMLSQSLALTAVLACVGCTLAAMNFPALVLESHKLVPDDVSAASSLIYFGLVIAIFAAPPFIGWIGDSLGLQTALIITAAGLIPVVLLAAKSIKYFDTPQIDKSAA